MTTTTLVEQPRMDIAGAAPDLYGDLVALGGDVRLNSGCVSWSTYARRS
jgi:hypothetical protein